MLHHSFIILSHCNPPATIWLIVGVVRPSVLRNLIKHKKLTARLPAVSAYQVATILALLGSKQHEGANSPGSQHSADLLPPSDLLGNIIQKCAPITRDLQASTKQ